MNNKKNVLGSALVLCSCAPTTGYFRDGYCRTDETDHGQHTVCVELTENFLQFSKAQGNDLSTPRPEFDFPGLNAGDRWCLCALRWKEAWEEGVAPSVILEACDQSVLEHISLEALNEHAIKAMH